MPSKHQTVIKIKLYNTYNQNTNNQHIEGGRYETFENLSNTLLMKVDKSIAICDASYLFLMYNINFTHIHYRKILDLH